MECMWLPWNYMKFHGSPWNSREFHEVPRNSMDFHGIPLGILHGSDWFILLFTFVVNSQGNSIWYRFWDNQLKTYRSMLNYREKFLAQNASILRNILSVKYSREITLTYYEMRHYRRSNLEGEKKTKGRFDLVWEHLGAVDIFTSSPLNVHWTFRGGGG